MPFEKKYISGKQHTIVDRQCGIKVLYFTPSTQLGNIEREIHTWAPHRTVIQLGNQTKIIRRFLIKSMKAMPEYVAVVNYEAWRRDLSLIDDLIDIEFDTMIIDEAHNIKNRKSIGYKGIKRIIDSTNIPFVYPMTGTPILNKPQELFTLLSLVDPRNFYNENYFLQDYCQQDMYDHSWKFRPGGLDALTKKMSNLYLRRTRDSIGMKLPPRTFVNHELEIDPKKYPKQAQARTQMRDWGSIMLDPSNPKSKFLAANAAIAVYTRLRQIETWPAGIQVKDDKGEVIIDLSDGFAESQKLDYLLTLPDSDKAETEETEKNQDNSAEGLLPEIIGLNGETGKAGERVIVFSMFKGPLYELHKRCEAAGIKSVMMTGDTNQDKRNEIAMDFDVKYADKRTGLSEGSTYKWDVLLAHYRVGGEGINLTEATQIIVLDSEWNPGKHDQAIERNYRHGQTKPVTVHYINDIKTIDTWMNTIVEKKRKLIDGFNEKAVNLANELWQGLKGGLI